jgi:hypothetical protein
MELIEVKAGRRKLKGFLMVFLGSWFLLLGSAERSEAQTFAEWFSQKKTLIKYLTQQIVALEQYSSYVKQGYHISQNGLGSIGGWVKGEFDMHSAYYSSLRTVNPQIKSNPKANAIADYALQIPGQFDQLSSLKGMESDMQDYVGKVKGKVLDECDKDLAELQMVMTSGQAEMTDDERFKRLDQLYSQMKDKYAFTQSFCNQVRILILQRSQELNNIQMLKCIYGIN